MLNSIQKIIIVRALRIRQSAGEKPEEVLKGYTKLTEREKAELLAELEESE